MCYSEHIATLIVTILFGLIIAYFAIQNTGTISLKFLTYTIPAIPIYIVVIGALLLGLFFSWVLSIVKSIGTGFTMRGKDSKIKGSKKENEELQRKITQLEIENAKLTTAANLPTNG